MSAAPSKSADLAKLVAAFVVAALAVALGGWWLLTRTGGVDGRVFHTGDRPASMTIGPNGWFAYSDDDGEWVEHAPTGERWGGERLYGSPVLTSDGTAVSTLGPEVRIARASGLVVTEGSDLLVAHGDKELLPGDEVEVIGLSTQHAAVVSCLSPAGQARLGKDVPGGRLVVSGVALEDGQVDWSHDTEVGCATRLATLYPHGLPEQRHVLLTPAEETTQALDLDTGAIAETWEQAPRGRVIVRQDEAVHRSGDTVSVTSLRSGQGAGHAPAAPERGSTGSVSPVDVWPRRGRRSCAAGTACGCSGTTGSSPSTARRSRRARRSPTATRWSSTASSSHAAETR